MALQSKLFAGDPKLEAAAVSDPAHIFQGARGEFVRKIQLALIWLDGADIAADGIFGPKTAAAVLAFKQKRDIVNRSYQSQADNIVGKMTMAALDQEIVEFEKRIKIDSAGSYCKFGPRFLSLSSNGSRSI
jgi:peptidoglycan hydrolase-like protein with peptidoglycan-binding domain